MRSFSYGGLDYEPTIPAMWHDVNDRHGATDFVVSATWDGGVERVTYDEAGERSDLLARHLLASGVVKGTRVGILAPNGPDFVVAFLAVTRIGAVAVPLNTFFQAPELRWVIADADLHTILVTPTLLGQPMAERLRAAVPGLDGLDQRDLQVPELPNLRQVLSLDTTAIGREGSSPLASAEMLAGSESVVRPADDLTIIYTSGSTSKPKGIIHVHGPAIRHTRFMAEEHGWSSDDRVYVPMAFFWVGGLVFGVLGPMQLGATILTEHRFEPGDVLRLLAAERATYALGFPHVGPALENHPDFAETDLRSMRDGYHQGLVPPERRAADPSLRVRTLGMTETCSSHTWWPPHEALPEAKRGSLGVDGPEFEHRVVDPDGNDVGVGESGEILVRGTAMMRGVVGRLRSEVFDTEGWYHTGDAAHADEDGHLYFGGRTDDMIKTSGANVAPMEVEATLVEMPEVREAYVIGLPDPDKGAIVTGVIVLSAGATASDDDLKAWCRKSLAAYKVPKRWVVYEDTSALPYTTTNKIDKRALTTMLAEDLQRQGT